MNIPTAKEIIIGKYNIDSLSKMIVYGEDVEKLMIEFTKLHVKAALEKIESKIEIWSNGFGSDYDLYVIDKDLLSNIYPLDNIK